METQRAMISSKKGLESDPISFLNNVLHTIISYLMQLNEDKKGYRPLSRRLDRCDRVIQDEVGDSNGGNV